MGCDHELLLDLSDTGLFKSLLMERSPLTLVLASLLMLERVEEVSAADLRFRKPVIFRNPLRKGDPGFLAILDGVGGVSEFVGACSRIGDDWIAW